MATILDVMILRKEHITSKLLFQTQKKSVHSHRRRIPQGTYTINTHNTLHFIQL